MPEIAEHQSPEEDLLHEGGQQHDDQKRCAGGVVDLGGDGGVIQVGTGGNQKARQAVHQLVKAVKPHKADADALGRLSQPVKEQAGGAAQIIVEDHDAHGEEDVVIDHVLQAGWNVGIKQQLHQAEQRIGGKGQHQQVDHKEHHARDLLARRHIRGGLFFGHRASLL